mmetsp:Transcript_4932/g.7451  ORF Transcript_4932/g.7451 Transcript_4932/m.7451 type:complete len:236 (-) Transcript_4932:213-920(-)
MHVFESLLNLQRLLPARSPALSGNFTLPQRPSSIELQYASSRRYSATSGRCSRLVGAGVGGGGRVGGAVMLISHTLAFFNHLHTFLLSMSRRELTQSFLLSLEEQYSASSRKTSKRDVGRADGCGVGAGESTFPMCRGTQLSPSYLHRLLPDEPFSLVYLASRQSRFTVNAEQKVDSSLHTSYREVGLSVGTIVGTGVVGAMVGALVSGADKRCTHSLLFFTYLHPAWRQSCLRL